MNFWTHIAIPIGGVVVAAIVAYIVAWKFGDVAGAEAAEKYAKDREARARRIALRAVWIEYIRIRSMAYHNMKLQETPAIQDMVKMPVSTFEAAFLSRESPLLDEGESKLVEKIATPEMPGLGELPEPSASRYRILVSQPLAAVTAYLTEAHSLNMLVDIYLNSPGSGQVEFARKGSVKKVKEKSKTILEILKPLDDYLAPKMGIPPEEK
jgi:hypothetical protein